MRLVSAEKKSAGYFTTAAISAPLLIDADAFFVKFFGLSRSLSIGVMFMISRHAGTTPYVSFLFKLSTLATCSFADGSWHADSYVYCNSPYSKDPSG